MNDKKPADGEEELGGEPKFSLIPAETLLAMFRALVKAEERRRGAADSSRGWKYDAAAVAVGQDLIPGDTVIAQASVRAVPLTKVAARSFEAELERALGVALLHRTEQTGKATVVFATDAREEAWPRALEAARAHRLPIVFVTELKDENSAEAGADLEPGTELPRIVVDGNDVVGSYRVAHEAIERARRNRGATLIECTAFRLKGRRPPNSVAMMKAYLCAKGILKA